MERPHDDKQHCFWGLISKPQKETKFQQKRERPSEAAAQHTTPPGAQGAPAAPTREVTHPSSHPGALPVTLQGWPDHGDPNHTHTRGN